MPEGEPVVIDAQLVQHRRVPVVAAHRTEDDAVTGVVRLAERHAGLNAACDEKDPQTARIAVATAVVGGQRPLRVNRPAELASPDHQRVVGQAVLLEIHDQRSRRLIGVIALTVDRLWHTAVATPTRVGQLDEPYVALGQSPREQADRRVGAGRLRLGAIGVFDRSMLLPSGGRLDQADATTWMAMYCRNLMRISLKLALYNSAYEDIATKFFKHFLGISQALTNIGDVRPALGDEADQSYYDKRITDSGEVAALRVRSMVGLIPLVVIETLEPDMLARLPAFDRRLKWYLKHWPELAALVSNWEEPGIGERRLLSLLRGKPHEEAASPDGRRAGRVAIVYVRRQLELAGTNPDAGQLSARRVAAKVSSL